ncbi:SCP domain-containing protein [Pseudozyma hubeiensis]|nr:SCP domain-containing protein [Pseudozyma hubeiensis]
MFRSVNPLSLALVALYVFVLITSEQVSARLLPFSAGHTNRSLRRSLLARRASADCANSKRALTPFVQSQINDLSSTSALHGGQKQERNTVLPDGRQVHVEANSDRSGTSRSWSWSWSSHSSSSSSTSSHSTTTLSSSDKDADQTSTKSDGDANFDSVPDVDQDKQEAIKGTTQPSPPIVHTELTSHSSQHSNSSKNDSSKTTNKDGKVTSHTSHTESSSSSSESSYSQTSTVYNYVVSGNAEKANNAAPFTDAQVHWTRPPPLFQASFSINSAVGHPIARPARADVCNRRFPFSNQQHTAIDQDHRFSQPFAEAALDPTSKIALDLHNAERARYGLQPLQWNVELANMASCWADLKAYGHSEDHFAASGENIAVGLGDPCYTDPMEGMKNAVYSFLDEDRNWARNPHMSEDNGHWTQIVWKETQFVGCAVSQRKHFMPESLQEDKASMYVVCEYYPPGNVEGQFEVMVPASVQPMPLLRSSCSINEKHGS